MFDIDKTNDRRQKIADAEAEHIGKLLSEARKTSDPIRLHEIKASISSIDPALSLDALLVTTDFLLATMPEDIKKATQAKDKASSAVAKKRDEIEKAIAKLNAELDQALDQYREAAQVHALAAVSHNRWEAIRTGIAQPGYSDFATPAIRAWARIEKLV